MSSSSSVEKAYFASFHTYENGTKISLISLLVIVWSGVFVEGISLSNITVIHTYKDWFISTLCSKQNKYYIQISPLNLNLLLQYDQSIGMIKCKNLSVTLFLKTLTVSDKNILLHGQ